MPVVSLGPIAYRLVSLEPLLVEVDALDDDDPGGPPISLRGDGVWRSASDSPADAARALRAALREADGPAPPTPRAPAARRRLDAYARWALVATWEAAALVEALRTSDEGKTTGPS